MKEELELAELRSDRSVTPRDVGRDFMTAFVNPLGGYYSQCARPSRWRRGKLAFGRGIPNRAYVQALIWKPIAGDALACMSEWVISSPTPPEIEVQERHISNR